MQTITEARPITNHKVGTSVWIGRGLSGVAVLFMLFDGAGKVAGEAHVVKAMAELGWPAGQTLALGLLALTCTILYAIPRTATLGAILLTGFLGGATAAKVRIEQPSLLFSVLMGVLVWAGLYLRCDRLRALLPFERQA